MISIEGEEEGNSHRRICWLNSTIGNNTQRIKKVLWHLSPIFNKILFRSNRDRIFEANVLEKNDVSIDSFRIVLSIRYFSLEKFRKFENEIAVSSKVGRRKFLRSNQVRTVSRISRRISVESKSEHDSIMDPRWPRYIRSITPCVAIQLCRTN